MPILKGGGLCGLADALEILSMQLKAVRQTFLEVGLGGCIVRH